MERTRLSVSSSLCLLQTGICYAGVGVNKFNFLLLFYSFKAIAFAVLLLVPSVVDVTLCGMSVINFWALFELSKLYFPTLVSVKERDHCKINVGRTIKTECMMFSVST